MLAIIGPKNIFQKYSHYNVSIDSLNFDKHFVIANSDLDLVKIQNSLDNTIHFLCYADLKWINYIDPIYYWEFIRKTINFQGSILYLENNLKEEERYFYVDLNRPSSTLSNFVNYNLSKKGSKSKSFPIMSPFSIEQQKVNQLKVY